ncbi:MAG: preprotein translocase subunit SecG [Desulfomonilia bacterium]|jgi:preprotein translocase subunit SecG|uniref:Protein-export membrane protein SecG n=1 Tax=anaerobic digester metagenome TaxID=1263854 RepID=A0A485LYW5_9ZZZZ|nr:preprotein translocase subunit SecG [Pseudomonadota bacterium]HON38008.1 preprotein translocase subunit SecG [Deltaproteobacteria bacterium]HRS55025.1 preprotein translocase subunit SecG [Desulfomonilia bacterium]HPD20742.1 preprotein translocase subunit SecG [Deltaproteobacteria bacterium]HPX18542.1 preprotein translocase subunit SecG [Deltaproteobacteria bacterium]
MYGVILTIHILVSVLLVIAVLLQSGKGADIGAVFGGAGSQALFGSAGPADFLNKSTRVLVVVFMLTSLTLGYFTFERPTQSIMDRQTTTAPAVPGESAPQPGSGDSAAPAAPSIPVAPQDQTPAESSPAQ